MSIKKRCNECKSKDKAEYMFSYKGLTYCQDCLYALVFDLAEDGIIKLYTDNVKEKGVIIYK